MSWSWPEQADLEVDELVQEAGTVFASLLHQDSGCRSYGVAVGGRRWFVKGAVTAGAEPSLRRAVVLHRQVSHPAIVPLRRVVGTPRGPVLVYPWVDAEVLYAGPHGRAARQAPESPHTRFRALPIDDVLDAFDRILDAHVAIAGAGFVAVDLYDGSFLYDFATRTMWLCDLDEYRPGPFVLDGERLPGSTRFMAPEESLHGARIDERTTVFDLGRSGLVLLDEREVGEAFRGTPAMAEVLAHATLPDPESRIQTVAELARSWRAAVEQR